jgi:trehalose synthase
MTEATTALADTATLGAHRIEDYIPLVGEQAVERILKKAAGVRGVHVDHVSSTYYGGGVAEILTPLTLLMNAMGIETDWRMIQGTPEFFACTKKIHNALQGAEVALSEEEKAVYEQVTLENGMRIRVDDCDAIIVHDPQPLPLVRQIERGKGAWLWQCHIDLSAPNPSVWNYLREFVESYDAALFSLPEYAQDLHTRQRFVLPAINPFSAKNHELTEGEIDTCLARYAIPTDRSLVVQISRFDKWKDPAGVVEAFRLACSRADCTLVLLGNHAIDDPEGLQVLETVQGSVDDRLLVISADDPLLVNALQRRAAVVLQKSLREGFGLTVTEAMWKGAAVIGGNVGGIRRQITDGENGFLVDTIPQATERMVQLLKDPALRERLGANARETVRKNYLLSRLAEDWIDVFEWITSPSGRRQLEH